jgi:hypothetical protein
VIVEVGWSLGTTIDDWDRMGKSELDSEWIQSLVRTLAGGETLGSLLKGQKSVVYHLDR